MCAAVHVEIGAHAASLSTYQLRSFAKSALRPFGQLYRRKNHETHHFDGVRAVGIAKGVKAGDVRFKVSLISDQVKIPVEETESTHIY